jgi:diguanylate cyclase (GGDEF)-like protein
VPLRNIERRIQNDEPFDIEGSREIRKVARAYNTLYGENKNRTLLLERMAQTDPLTGLYNRGSFDQVLSQFTPDMALLAVDVDLFKEINDRYGHEVGDKVLQKVASELRRAFDDQDYCCRIGGDEFAVVVVDSGRESRLEIATLLKGVCENLRDGSGETPAVTLSVGIAFGSDVPEGVTVYHAADKALYAAKRNGRNQYAIYEG